MTITCMKSMRDDDQHIYGSLCCACLLLSCLSSNFVHLFLSAVVSPNSSMLSQTTVTDEIFLRQSLLRQASHMQTVVDGDFDCINKPC